MLKMYGHATHLAFDGEEAMLAVKKHKPDVILLDVQLPKVSGLDVARMLVEQGDKKPLLIAISGYCTTADKAAAYKVGFDHFFAKPMDPNDLCYVLEEQENHIFISKRGAFDNSVRPGI